MCNLQENGSSEEEDLILDNVPDDDEYDTEDSFIDDTELVSTALSSSSIVSCLCQLICSTKFMVLLYMSFT